MNIIPDEPLELRLNKSKDELEALKIEFDQLETVDQKLKFWYDKLDKNYCTYDKCNYQEIRPFLIRPSSDEEIKYLNEQVLEEYQLYRKAFLPIPKYLYKSFEELKEEFLKRIDGVINTKQFIQEEILEVDKEYLQWSKQTSRTIVFQKFFKSGFDNYYFKSEIPDLSKIILEPTTLAFWVSGKELAEFKLYLESYKPTSRNNQFKFFETQQLTIKQKLLILDYLKFPVKNFHENESLSAEFIALLLGVHPQTVRSELSSFHKLRHGSNSGEKKLIQENLSVIIEVFEKLGLKGQVKQAKADLAKASQ